MKLTQPPIFRMYHLTIEHKDQKAFVAEGTHNMFTSIENEPQTLAMYATHSDELGESNFIFELYQDSDSYQVHANSPQFKRYGQLAQQVLVGRHMYELHPQLLLTSDNDIKVNGSDVPVTLTEFTLKSDKIDTFKNNLQQLVPANIGKAIYVATQGDSETNWISLEVGDLNDQSILQQLIQENQKTFSQRHLIFDTMVSQPLIEYRK